ncbi:MAG: hypothetical protein ACLQE9_03660 [Roseiarcus sp.]
MRKMLALGTASLFISLGGALLASAGAYADDPTGVLLSEQRWYNGPPLTRQELNNLPAYSDVGPCQPGMQQEAFPNMQGYRCIRPRQ